MIVTAGGNVKKKWTETLQMSICRPVVDFIPVKFHKKVGRPPGIHTGRGSEIRRDEAWPHT